MRVVDILRDRHAFEQVQPINPDCRYFLERMAAFIFFRLRGCRGDLPCHARFLCHCLHDAGVGGDYRAVDVK